mgnify:FL=1
MDSRQFSSIFFALEQPKTTSYLWYIYIYLVLALWARVVEDVIQLLDRTVVPQNQKIYGTVKKSFELKGWKAFNLW